MTVGLYN